jgi:hypothetical protein
MGGDENCNKILIREPEGKGILGRSRHKWEDGNRMDHREIKQEVTDSIHLAQDRDHWQALVNTMMNHQIP